MAIGRASALHSGGGLTERMSARCGAAALRGGFPGWGGTALALLVLLALAPSAATATTARATATATVVAPVALGKDGTSLNFGAVDPSHVRGTVSLGTDGLRWAGGADLTSDPRAEVAGFTVSGEPDCAFTITLPKRVVLVAGDAGLQVTDFTHDAGGAPTLDGTGAQRFRIGAVLRAGPALAKGSHLGNFAVTVSWD